MPAVNISSTSDRPVVENLFLEDVVSWLDANEMRYTPEVKCTGLTGCDYLFHFVIPKSRKHPERIVQAINRPSRETALSFINAWIDTRQTRPPESSAYAMRNDVDNRFQAT